MSKKNNAKVTPGEQAGEETNEFNLNDPANEETGLVPYSQDGTNTKESDYVEILPDEPQPSAPPVSELPHQVHSLKYDFTAVEIHDLSNKLANKNQELRRQEDEKKSNASLFKSKIDAINEDINLLAMKVTSGHEYRDIDCEVNYNVPERGKKTLIRTDTKQCFIEKMELRDYEAAQLEMDLETGASRVPR